MRFSMMRIFMIVLLFALTACSGEDQPSGPPPSPKVVQTIKQPAPEPEKAPPAAVEKKPEQAPAQKPDLPKPPMTSTDEALERPSKPPMQEPAAAKPAAPAQEEKKRSEKPGHYAVRKGDTLSIVASREDTMQDPLKWPILLRLNHEKLAAWPNGEDFATRELPTGLELRYITPREAKEGLEKPSGSTWVVNLLSASSEAEIVPPAVILSRQGYPVYITRAYVKGKDYLRLRVGFFKSRKEAEEQGEKIRKLVGLKEFWATKVDEVEYEEVIGFLKSP